MAATATVRMHGLKETIRAFNKIDRNLAGEVKDELKKVAEPIASTAQSKISRYQGAKVSQIGPRVSTRSVFVTQRARKVTGRRADFGRLQMRRLEEALGEHEGDIEPALEEALDRLTNGAGF